MEKRIKSINGLAGLLSVSALALAVSGSANALTSAQYGANALIADPNVAASGVGLSVSTTLATQSPYAPASSINIATSRHNLGTTNNGQNGTTDTNHTPDVVAADGVTVIGTNQICVFCHTPHGFNTTQSGPLWNKAVSTAAYTVYNAGTNTSSTLDADAPVIGSVSLACLSCHDGTQALDSMINAPGTAGMAGQGANSSVSRGYTWLEFGQMNADGTDNTNGTNAVVVAGGNPQAEGLTIGGDFEGATNLQLGNDHPISVQYCGGMTATTNGGGAAAISDGACNDAQFILPTVATINGTQRFWIDTVTQDDPDANQNSTAVTRVPFLGTTAVGTDGFTTDTAGDGKRTKTDLPLFSNNAGVVGPSVECATCHDPHTPNNGTFLRVSNYASGLCLSCHVK